ncbi:MAG: hypothetical protein ABI760_08880 [Ferruginibacter sp.]
MVNAKRNLFLSITGLVLIVSVIAWYMYNKEGPDIENASAEKVAATDLYDSFVRDSVGAKKMYMEKILEVSGEVIQVNKNQELQAVILVRTYINGASLNCTMEGPAGDIKKGDKVLIKGICKGMGPGDPDLGILPDVYLTRCYIVR